MGTRLTSLCLDANDPGRLAAFWSAALGYEITEQQQDVVTVTPTDGTPFVLDFLCVPEPKVGKNRIHLDLVAESIEHRDELVDRLVGLGATHVDVGQSADEEHTVLADPEGNELCVVPRGEFLATVTSAIGAVVFEPAPYPEVGRFWSEATGWPIVYDDDGDVALRDPSGAGPYLTFGPPDGAAKSTKNRLHLDVSPWPDDDQAAEVARLVAAGARPIDIGQGDVPWVVLADPDGNELCVLTPR